MSTRFRTWGTKTHERLLNFPCDDVLKGFDDAYYRGVSIHAPREVIFRWLCQMRIAPYSYDWIDNFGRQSPQSLIPGLDELARGQRVMTIFELVDFARNKHLTIRTKKGRLASRLFGEVAISYLIIPAREGECRLVVKCLVRYPRGILGVLHRLMLPWGDLIMMRRQLLNFKDLSVSLFPRRCLHLNELTVCASLHSVHNHKRTFDFPDC